MSARRVVVLGDVMLDVVVRPEAPIEPTSDTPSTVYVTRGGSGANLAVALRATGHDVLFVGAAGRDAACEIFVKALHRAGVTSELETVNEPTGTVVILVHDDGQRSMLTDRGANQRLSEAFVEECLAGPFDHLHVSGYLLHDPGRRDVGERALAIARERGSSTSIDVCSVGPLRKTTPEVFLRSAGHVTQLFANDEEAMTITSCPDTASALDALAIRFEEAIITWGANGALGAAGAERFSSPAREVPVRDTTGAGDAAAGTYLGARLHGVPPAPALASAMVAAARTVTGLGATG